jgi:hypothetical protein
VAAGLLAEVAEALGIQKCVDAPDGLLPQDWIAGSGGGRSPRFGACFLRKPVPELHDALFEPAVDEVNGPKELVVGDEGAKLW